LDVIENFLKDNYDNYSSQEIAEVLGVSGSTARRYLEFLLLSGRVTAEYAYRKVGRPEKRYRIVLF
ncbi:MAG: HTH domain-containing protein, partial [Synergistaceae bacterium]|nr:HTH domain-containing protein [Synergistaceae bacterium]